MKNIGINTVLGVVVLLAALFFSIPAQAKKNDAKIVFKETVYDFGNVSLKDGKISHVFTFTNEGERNLVITNARADCGCTKPEYSDEPIAPGKSGSLKVTFAPVAKGHFTKKITVTSTGKPQKTRLLIKGNVTE